MIPITKPYITKADCDAVAAVVKTGWILQGPRVAEFETLLKQYIQTPYAVTTSSATTALHMALMILGIGPGDEVIVPSFSFIASANCIVHAGATPVFVDIDPKTYNLDPKDVQKKITKKTKAIMVVHQIGLPADIFAISRQLSAIRQKIYVIEDAACALGSFIGKQHVGTFGDIGAFSFHPRKAITTAEGGLLVTKNKSWAKTAEMMRAHGASLSVADRHTSTKIKIEEYPIIGYNYRMSDIHAALGISQFAHLSYILKRRKEIAETYNNAFANHPRIVIPFVPTGYTHTYQSYMIRIKDGTRIRNSIMQSMLDAGITVKRGIMAAHMEKPYRKLYPHLSLPHTERATRETITLPTYTTLTKKEQTLVIKTLLTCLS